MANFQKSKSDDDRRRCKRHPKHRQSPGVCSLCLTEKLSQIATSSSSRKTTSASLPSSSSASSYYSSASSSCSSCSSPNPYGYSMDRRKAPISSSSNSIFKKSRSLVFAPRFRRSERGSDSGKKSNLGFWSRFLSRPRRKRMEMEEVLSHSRTVVQRDVHG